MPKAHIDNLKRYRINPDTGCWDWDGQIHPKGYGKTSRNIHGTRIAHRVLYIERIGPVPDGLELDHLCRNRACVNPWHLEPVTPEENTRRGWRARFGTRCLKRGHDLTLPDAIGIDSGNGRRFCRQCRRLTWKLNSHKRRAQLRVAA